MSGVSVFYVGRFSPKAALLIKVRETCQHIFEAETRLLLLQE